MAKNLSALYNEFRQVLSQEELDLAKAAMIIAQLEYPDLNPANSLRMIDSLTDTIKERIPPSASLEEKLRAIIQHLFHEEKYRGNDQNYYDPRNSCLNEVLVSKLGIPISLSVLFIEIAGRLGLSVDGISFPGHFLVQVKCDEGMIVLDPFNHGETLSEYQLRRRLVDIQGDEEAYNIDLHEWLVPASPEEMLVRMLRNLKRIYTDERNNEKAIAAMSLILIADPSSSLELRERGLLYREMEAFRAALADLTDYLKTKPDAEDAEVVHHLVIELQVINARLN
jgi:regulator of sirC expression with transglutaminase-like and TPR domain